MSLRDYENVIVKAHDIGALWPERCVSREDIASVEAKLGVMFSEQMLDFYMNCGDMTISDRDVLWLDPHDTEDRIFNLLAVTLEAREAGLPSHLIPFFNTCDDDGNIAYFDFSRMQDGEPLVTVAYFGEEGFVVTSETTCDFGAFLLKNLNSDPSVHPPKNLKLTKDQAEGLLHYVEKKDTKYFYNVTFPKVFFGGFIALGIVAIIVAFVIKSYVIIPGSLFLIGMMIFLLYYFGRGRNISNSFNDIVTAYGKDALLTEMTSDHATVFYLNKNDPSTYVVGTDGYLILVYDNIYPWHSIESVSIKKHIYPQSTIDSAYDQEDRDKMTYAYSVEIRFTSGLTRSHLMISLTPQDMHTFAEYLRTKVPEVHRL